MCCVVHCMYTSSPCRIDASSACIFFCVHILRRACLMCATANRQPETVLFKTCGSEHLSGARQGRGRSGPRIGKHPVWQSSRKTMYGVYMADRRVCPLLLHAPSYPRIFACRSSWKVGSSRSTCRHEHISMSVRDKTRVLL